MVKKYRTKKGRGMSKRKRKRKVGGKRTLKQKRKIRKGQKGGFIVDMFKQKTKELFTNAVNQVEGLFNKKGGTYIDEFQQKFNSL
jgi:hypothetical protein